jgi:hypothetical protein
MDELKLRAAFEAFADLQTRRPLFAVDKNLKSHGTDYLTPNSVTGTNN